MQREFRESSDMRPSVAGLAGVLAVAGVLRLWDLGHGIPGSLAGGEPELMQRVIRMMQTGDFNPHSFDNPGLYGYAQLVVACARFLVGVAGGAWHSLAEVGPPDFYSSERLLTAILGIATVYLVYVIGTRWGARHALLAAGLMAVMPDHVAASRTMLAPVPTTFMVTLTFLLALRAHEEGTVRAYAWAGVGAGAAMATSYAGSLALLLPLLAAFVPPKGPNGSLRPALAALGGFGVAFLLGAPYTVLDLPGFLNGVGASAAYPTAPGGSAWLSHLAYFAATFWWPGLILLLAGVGLAVARIASGPGRGRFAMLLGVPLVQVVVIGARGQIAEYGVLPIVPFACLVTSIAVISGVSLLRRFAIPRAMRTALIVAATVATLLPPFVTSINVLRRGGAAVHGRTDLQKPAGAAARAPGT